MKSTKNTAPLPVITMPKDFPVEMSLKMTPRDINPMKLLALIPHKDRLGNQSTWSHVAWDNDSWTDFVPQEEKNKLVSKGHHAEKFIERYQNMSPKERNLLATLCSGAKNEKAKAILELARTPKAHGDFDIIRAAVSVDGNALRFAKKNLRLDQGIVLVAVRQYGPAIFYAHDSLKSDRDFMLAAIKTDDRAFEFAHESLKIDSKFRALAGFPPLLSSDVPQIVEPPFPRETA